MSGLLGSYLNSTIRRFELSFGFLGFLFFCVKKSKEGLWINDREARINFPKLSAEIADPKFLLGSTGSIMIILLWNVFKTSLSASQIDIIGLLLSISAMACKVEMKEPYFRIKI